MFDAVQGVEVGYVLCGVIWAIAMGFAVGNYACSLVHRLPRGRLLLDKKPYCGNCGHELEVRDLFPVFSAVSLKHKCRYCHVPFPTSHTWTEILVGLLFVLGFLQHGFGEQFLLIACLGVFLITLAAIHANEGVVMGKMLLCIAVFGMLHRTQVDGSIYGFFQGGLIALVVGAVIWRKEIKPAGHVFTLPTKLELFTIGGLCVGLYHLPLFAFYFLLFYGLSWAVGIVFSRSHKPIPLSVAFGFAVMLPVLYPHLTPWVLPHH